MCGVPTINGYEPRMKAALEALGGQRDEIELIDFQFVHLIGGGERHRDVQARRRVRNA